MYLIIKDESLKEIEKDTSKFIKPISVNASVTLSDFL